MLSLIFMAKVTAVKYGCPMTGQFCHHVIKLVMLGFMHCLLQNVVLNEVASPVQYSKAMCAENPVLFDKVFIILVHN